MLATAQLKQAEIEEKIHDMRCANLNDLHTEEKLCDVVIKTEDVEFKAHKIVLCGCSLYFRTLFTGAWATSDKLVYTIPGVSPEMMSLIIDYAYTNSVTLTADNVLEALEAADQFVIPGIVYKCCFFLEDALCLTNCINIWKMVDFYNCPELKIKVFLYILQHFEEITSVSQDFPELTVEQLAVIIENDHLNVKREDTVLEAVFCWINHLPEKRQSFISMLLSRVRLGLLTDSSLQKLFENTLVEQNNQCAEILRDAVEALIEFRIRGHSGTIYRNPLCRPRMPSALLFVTGGKDGITPATNFQAYDSHSDCWANVGTDGVLRAHHGAAVLNNFVYLVGGCNREVYLNTVQKLDFLSYTWHHVAPMSQPRCYVAVTALDGCIYAMGGFNGQSYLNCVECYRPEIGLWTPIASMHARRSGAGAAALNGKVYICGGVSGARSLTTAECYDPETNAWITISPMRTPRRGLGVAAYKDHIYAVGGLSNGAHFLNTAEAYNPDTNRWYRVPPMYNRRSYFGLGVVDDQLFAVGGYNGSITLQTVERYNEESGMWFGAAHIEYPRSSLSCCVLHGLQQLAERLFPRHQMRSPDAAAEASN